MLRFETEVTTKVLFDKLHIGDIVHDDNGYRYKVKGKKIYGEYFPTLVGCKISLAENN